MRRNLFVSLVVCLSLAAPLAMAQQFSSVEERMSSADFKAAGLDKLSPEELARLNAFVRHEVETKAAQAQVAAVRQQEVESASRMGLKGYDGDREEIVSTIPGHFTGWTGTTTFTLENGQVWRQNDSSSQLAGIHLESPTVHIVPGMFGSWSLHVDGYNTTTKVERVQ